MNRSTLLLITIILSLCGVLAIWLIYYVEWETIEDNAGWSDKARRDPYFAAKLFLEKQGHKTQSFSSGMQTLDALETDGADSLFVFGSQGLFSEGQSMRLWDYVVNGGNLVLSPEILGQGSLLAIQDHFLDLLAVDYVVVESEYEDDLDYDDFKEHCYQYVSSNRVRGLTEPVSAGFNRDSYFLFNEDYFNETIRAEVDGYPVLSTWSVGSGQLTLINSPDIWNNSGIACYQNAELLLHLIQRTGESQSIVILHNKESFSLLMWLWHYALGLSFALLAALGLFLWNKSVRFGPVLVEKSFHQTSFLRHIEASTQYLLKNIGPDILVKSLRKQIDTRMQLHHPNYTYMTLEQQIDVLTHQTQLNAEEVHLAMNDQNQIPKSRVLQVLTTLRLIRERL